MIAVGRKVCLGATGARALAVAGARTDVAAVTFDAFT